MVSTKSPKVHIIFVLDESGSMDGTRLQTIDGFNEYFNSVKTKDTGNTRMTLMKFNSNGLNYVFTRAKLQDVSGLSLDTYQPDNGTPLYDAIGRAIEDQKAFLKTKKSKHATMVIIMTDGLENTSQKYNKLSVSNLIAECKKNDWTFVFMGANIDSFAEAGSIGIAKGSVLNYDQSNVQATYRAAAFASNRYQESGGVQTDSAFSGYVPDDDDGVEINVDLSNGTVTNNSTSES